MLVILPYCLLVIVLPWLLWVIRDNSSVSRCRPSFVLAETQKMNDELKPSAKIAFSTSFLREARSDWVFNWSDFVITKVTGIPSDFKNLIAPTSISVGPWRASSSTIARSQNGICFNIGVDEFAPTIALVLTRFGEPVAWQIRHDETGLLPEIKVNAAGFSRLLTHLRDLVSNECVDERAFADVGPTHHRDARIGTTFQVRTREEIGHLINISYGVYELAGHLYPISSEMNHFDREPASLERARPESRSLESHEKTNL